MKIKKILLPLLLVLCLTLTSCSQTVASDTGSSVDSIQTSNNSLESQTESSVPEQGAASSAPAKEPNASVQTTEFSLSDVPAFSNSPYYVINDNEPYFTAAEKVTTSFENYSSLDSMGRCGVAYANVCIDTMPTEERGSIGQVKPSGWHTVKYDCVDGKYLYNRCHLIGYQLTAENANTSNLITGTRYLNVDGMLPFENLVADYVKETNNHVLYRVTPIFNGNNLVASGVLMEAYSVEDEGEGVCFNVYCYNNQPGVEIDYLTGESWLSSESNVSVPVTSTVADTPSATQSSTEQTYILNTNTKKFHYPSCSSVSQMKDENKETYSGSRETLIADGYEPCGRCKP